MSTLKFDVHPNDHHRGNLNAALTLVEYGDFECPYCKRAHALVTRLLKEKSNELHFVFRNFPLRKIHPHAYASAITAEVAGRQGKFWEMHDLIFENQNKLTTSFLLHLAECLDLDLEKFSRDSKSIKVLNKIDTDFESGVHSGVNRTPSFFINGSLLLTYDETYESLFDAIQPGTENKSH